MFPDSLPKRFEDQDSGYLTLNHLSVEGFAFAAVPPTIDSALVPILRASCQGGIPEIGNQQISI